MPRLSRRVVSFDSSVSAPLRSSIVSVLLSACSLVRSRETLARSGLENGVGSTGHRLYSWLVETSGSDHTGLGSPKPRPKRPSLDPSAPQAGKPISWETADVCVEVPLGRWCAYVTRTRDPIITNTSDGTAEIQGFGGF